MARLAVLTKKKRVAVVVAATGLTVIAALAWFHLANAPERVTPPTEAAQYQPPRVAADAPVAAAPTDADYVAVVDVTGELVQEFTGDLAYARSSEQQRDAFPYGEADTCLLEWASAQLPVLAATGAYEVMTVCDRPTLVLAGPAGADTKVLVRGALEDTAPAGARELIGESETDRMAFVAVRSTDGKAQLLATSALPE